MSDLYAQHDFGNLNKKWMIYNTVSVSEKGWNSFVNNYIFDFTSKDNLIIKVLNDSAMEKIVYSVDYDKGEIRKDDGELLYQIKKLDSENLILIVGTEQKTELYLYAVYSDKERNNLTLAKKVIIKHKWFQGMSNIEFQNKKFALLGEIETDYKSFIEYDEGKKKTYEGGWAVDIYDNILFLELYSSRYNFKTIYKIETLNDEMIRASAINKDGNKIILDWCKN